MLSGFGRGFDKPRDESGLLGEAHPFCSLGVGRWGEPGLEKGVGLAGGWQMTIIRDRGALSLIDSSNDFPGIKHCLVGRLVQSKRHRSQNIRPTQHGWAVGLNLAPSSGTLDTIIMASDGTFLFARRFSWISFSIPALLLKGKYRPRHPCLSTRRHLIPSLLPRKECPCAMGMYTGHLKVVPRDRSRMVVARVWGEKA